MDIFLAEVPNSNGDNVNPARKAWQEIEQFLYQFSNPNEHQIIVSMLDGLGAVAQAALNLGHFDVIAFEKDPVTWMAAVKVISQEIAKMNKKEKDFQNKIREALDVQKVILKSVSDKEELEEDDVW